jgi:ribosomal protein S18 acetylase RimI-like enzyme
MVPEGPTRGNPDGSIDSRGGVVIRLEAMDEAAYERWQATSIPEYAREKVEAGTWLESEAFERSAQSYRQLLPNGLATPGQVMRSIVTENDERVGYAWWAPEERPFGRVAFIYDIAVFPEHRRRGYAQAALTGIEAWAREHGCVGVQLHVHGPNAGARELYRRAGFVETDVTMLKRVDG